MVVMIRALADSALRDDCVQTGVSNQVGPIEVLSYDAYRRVTSNYTVRPRP